MEKRMSVMGVGHKADAVVGGYLVLTVVLSHGGVDQIRPSYRLPRNRPRRLRPSLILSKELA